MICYTYLWKKRDKVLLVNVLKHIFIFYNVDIVHILQIDGIFYLKFLIVTTLHEGNNKNKH